MGGSEGCSVRDEVDDEGRKYKSVIFHCWGDFCNKNGVDENTGEIKGVDCKGKSGASSHHPS